MPYMRVSRIRGSRIVECSTVVESLRSVFIMCVIRLVTDCHRFLRTELFLRKRIRISIQNPLTITGRLFYSHIYAQSHIWHTQLCVHETTDPQTQLLAHNNNHSAGLFLYPSPWTVARTFAPGNALSVSYVPGWH